MAQSAITKGATVLVVDPLDSGVGAHIESDRQGGRRRRHRLRPAHPRRQPQLLRQLQQRPRRHPARRGPGVLRRRLGRQEPAGHRHAAAPPRTTTRRCSRRATTRCSSRCSPPASGWTSPTRPGPGRLTWPLSEFTQTYTAHKNINAALIPNDENGAPIIHYLQGQGIKAAHLPDHRPGRHADRPRQHPVGLPVRHRLQADLRGGPGRRRARDLRCATTSPRRPPWSTGRPRTPRPRSRSPRFCSSRSG